MLSRKDVMKWYEEYPEEAGQRDVELEERLLRRARKTKKPSEFENVLLGEDGILDWKGALFWTQKYYRNLTPLKWKKFFLIAMESRTDSRCAVKAIVEFSQNNMKWGKREGGISYPVASTIVCFFSNGNCPIIDRRAVYTLKKKGYSRRLEDISSYPIKGTKRYRISLGDEEWDVYHNLCHEIVKELDVQPQGNDTALRVLDKALWTYPSL